MSTKLKRLLGIVTPEQSAGPRKKIDLSSILVTRVGTGAKIDNRSDFLVSISKEVRDSERLAFWHISKRLLVTVRPYRMTLRVLRFQCIAREFDREGLRYRTFGRMQHSCDQKRSDQYNNRHQN